MTKTYTLVLVLMDDFTVDDEKKPFDALGTQNDDDSQLDPNEHLMLESGCSAVWLVKVCKMSAPHFRWVTLNCVSQNWPLRFQNF